MKWCMRPRACVLGVCDAAGCCPALVEGRAEFSWCAKLAARACCCWPRLPWCAQSCALAMHHKNAALPLRRAGQCCQKVRFQVRNLVEVHAAPFSLVFLAPK
ncbi:uncharacterized protein DS421_2g48410 [Arachis hypogaea]|nr:uncharacterized protein DS421_2g48410 [Arachis hypogaea]